MLELDLEKGVLNIDGERHTFNKENCTVIEKGSGTARKLKLVCGDERDE